MCLAIGWFRIGTLSSIIRTTVRLRNGSKLHDLVVIRASWTYACIRVTRRRAASEADQTCPFLARTAHALTVRLAYQTRRIYMLIGATTILHSYVWRYVCKLMCYRCCSTCKEIRERRRHFWATTPAPYIHSCVAHSLSTNGHQSASRRI